ncbi:MAG: DNA-methyltransferase [Terriglobia bacterium]
MACIADFAFDFRHSKVGGSLILNADCFEWMARANESSIHAIVTDPPYGVKEYELGQLAKRANGTGGIWRIPPSFDGANRQPLPRFTALNPRERKHLAAFFGNWAKAAGRVLRPGGHVFIACNSFLCQLVYGALVDGGLEFRGQLIRVVRTLRGGDRPKNAETEFPGVCSMPRGGYEPWGILRKPLPTGMKVADCLRHFETGGLRRHPTGLPFTDLIEVGRTPKEERARAKHPSLKPQSLMRELVYSSLPLGRGVILDPFMGSGSTVAAANALGLQCVGIERNPDFFAEAAISIERLAKLAVPRDQLSLALA